MPGRQDRGPAIGKNRPPAVMARALSLTVETHVLQREVFFVFGEFEANVSGAYDKNYRAGGGVSGGVMANVTDNWKWLISGGYLGYPLGDQSDDVHISVGQRFTLAKIFAFRMTTLITIGTMKSLLYFMGISNSPRDQANRNLTSKNL
jgi:hypothetical protein